MVHCACLSVWAHCRELIVHRLCNILDFIRIVHISIVWTIAFFLLFTSVLRSSHNLREAQKILSLYCYSESLKIRMHMIAMGVLLVPLFNCLKKWLSGSFIVVSQNSFPIFFLFWPSCKGPNLPHFLTEAHTLDQNPIQTILHSKIKRQRKGCYTEGRWRNASPFCLFCMAAFSWATHPKQYLLSVKIFTTITVFFTLHKNKIIGAFSENIKLSTMLKCNMGNNLLFSDKQKIYLHSADW